MRDYQVSSGSWLVPTFPPQLASPHLTRLAVRSACYPGIEALIAQAGVTGLDRTWADGAGKVAGLDTR